MVWEDISEQKKRIKRKRIRDAQRRILPKAFEFCKEKEIMWIELEYGYQFRIREYFVNYYPSSNSVVVQSSIPGSRTVSAREEQGRENEPRLLVVLKKVFNLVKGEDHED